MTTFTIIDNEKEDQLRFVSILKRIDSNFKIFEYESISSQTKCDFLLLDIELDEEDGIHQLSSCLKQTKYVIYISLVKERMQEAFSKNVIGFILKHN